MSENSSAGAVSKRLREVTLRLEQDAITLQEKAKRARDLVYKSEYLIDDNKRRVDLNNDSLFALTEDRKTRLIDTRLEEKSRIFLEDVIPFLALTGQDLLCEEIVKFVKNKRYHAIHEGTPSFSSRDAEQIYSFSPIGKMIMDRKMTKQEYQGYLSGTLAFSSFEGRELFLEGEK